jgi:hypothetical protein
MTLIAPVIRRVSAAEFAARDSAWRSMDADANVRRTPLCAEAARWGQRAHARNGVEDPVIR